MSQRILFVGGDKGSWEIRGRQMAKALGARATQTPTTDDWRWADIIVLVKRSIDLFGADAARTGKPIVWDVLDYWQQPEENGMSVDEMTGRVMRLSQACLIGATNAMASRLGGVYIPHHSRPGLTPQPIRGVVKTVAYEGATKYLGSWKAVCEKACAARGWSFVVNPKSLSDADIVVALRGEKWDGALCREWKSGVKLVNAMAAGRPVISQACAAQREIQPIGSVIETQAELEAALDYWATVDHRVKATDSRLSAPYTLESIANQYRAVFRSLLQEAA